MFSSFCKLAKELKEIGQKISLYFAKLKWIFCSYTCFSVKPQEKWSCCFLELKKSRRSTIILTPELMAYAKRTWGQNFQTSTALYYGARPVFEEARKYFLLLLLSNYGRRFWRSYLLELRTQLFILLRS